MSNSNGNTLSGKPGVTGAATTTQDRWHYVLMTMTEVVGDLESGTISASGIENLRSVGRVAAAEWDAGEERRYALLGLIVEARAQVDRIRQLGICCADITGRTERRLSEFVAAALEKIEAIRAKVE